MVKSSYKMRFYQVQMLYENKLNTLLDYILEFTLTVLFVELKYTNTVQKLVIIATRAWTFVS